MNILCDQRGGVATSLLLVLLTLFLIGLVLSYDIPRLVRESDTNIGGAVEEAVRAATAQIDEASKKDGDPRIIADQAHEAFRKSLAKNLALSEDNLLPLEGSSLISSPKYTLIVFNGNNPYVTTGGIYQDGSLVEELNEDLPKSFVVSEGRSFALNKPGCVAIIASEHKPVFWPVIIYVSRYAAAEVEIVGDNVHIALKSTDGS